MKQYKEIVEYILENGEVRENRTDINTLGVFGAQMRFDLGDGFPILTTKKMPFKSVVSELMWFLEGSSDERRLAELHYGKPRSELVGKKTIWTANADKQGRDLGYQNTDYYKELGPIYGHQWRELGVDQIRELVLNLRSDPFSRRHIINSWNVEQIREMALPPCHVMAQFHVSNDRKLSCQVYQRSVDVGLGLPFNIASYALLTHILAKEVGMDVGELVHVSGDCHIYENHIEALKKQIQREPLPLPTLNISPEFELFHNNGESLFEMDVVENFKLENYESHQSIAMEMAV